jgi:hypothetical protein
MVVTIVVLLLAGGGGGCVGRTVDVVETTGAAETLLEPNRLLQPNVRGGFGGTGST